MSLDQFLLSANTTDLDYPNFRPTLDLNFAKTKTLDSRITFTRSSGGTYVGPDGLIKYAGVNQPRFDHDPLTGESLGLLVEEQRTNLCTQSEISGWTVGILGSGGALPTGWVIAQQQGGVQIQVIGGGTEKGFSYVDIRWSGTTSNTNRSLINIGSNITTNGSNYYSSIYTKLVSGSATNITVLNFPSWTGPNQQINLSTTSVLSRGSGDSAVYSGLKSPRVDVGPAAVGVTFDITLRIAAPQFEVGSFPTSYIPTSGSTRTRATDFATITGNNFTSIFNRDEGTFLINALVSPNLFGVLAEMRDTNVIDCPQMFSGYGYVAGNITRRAALYTPNSIDGYINSEVFLTYTPKPLINNYSFAYKDYNSAVSVNGITPSVNTIKIVGKSITALTIGRDRANTTAGFYNSSISRIMYWNKRLPNTQLQALTR